MSIDPIVSVEMVRDAQNCQFCGSGIAHKGSDGSSAHFKCFSSLHVGFSAGRFQSPTCETHELKALRQSVSRLNADRDTLATQLERANEEIEVHKDRIQDLRQLVQEYRQCIRPGDLANLREEEA